MYNSKDFTPLRSWTIDSDVNVTKQLLKDNFEEVIRAAGYKVAVYDIEIDKRLPAISIRNREDDRHMGVYVYCDGNIVEMAIEGKGHQVKATDLEKVYSKAVGAMRGVHQGYMNTKNILGRFGMRGTGVSIGAGVGVAAGAVIGTSLRAAVKIGRLLFRDQEAYDKEMAFYELAIGFGDYIVGGTDPAGVTKALIKNAEENNDEIAQYLLGNAYCEGRGVEVSLDESIRYYALAAKNGEKRSREILAVEYLYGEREYTVEEKWTGLIYLTELADNGDVAAANSLVDIYGTGDIEGIPADAEKTIEVAEKYAGEGNVYACMILANIYDSDKVSSKVDFDAYKDDKKAFEYYVQLIQHDESSYVEEAAISLAHMHRDSRGVEGSREEELRYYRLAALKGNLEAKCVLANAYTLGLGIDKDHSVAQKLCNELIRSGNKEVLPIAYYCNYVIADEAKKYKVSMENARKYISLENAEEEKKKELQKYLAEQEELISKMTDEEQREYLQERKPLFGGFKKKEKGEGAGGNKKIVIAIVAVLAVIVLIFALTKCNGNQTSETGYSDGAETKQDVQYDGDDYWEFFNSNNVIGLSSSEIESKYGYLNPRNSEVGTCWQDLTLFGSDFWFVDGSNITFSFGGADGTTCEAMAGTAEEIFGITAETNIDDLSSCISPDKDFSIGWRSDIGYRSWNAEKHSEISYAIYLYQDSLQSISYLDKYDPFSDSWVDIPEATSSNYTDVFTGFNGDPTIIQPSTNVVIVDMNGVNYEAFFW